METRTDGGGSLLINWLVYPAVGHALEAFKHAHGYLELNPQLDIHVLLPPTPATTLAPEGITVHPIDLSSPARDMRRLPADWDYVITDSRLLRLRPDETLLLRARQAADEYFRARIATGVAPTFEEQLGEDAAAVLPYRRNFPLRLAAPKLDPERFGGSPSALNICVLPAGSTSRQSPTPSAWRSICKAIERRHGDVTFHFTGRSAPAVSTRRRVLRRLAGAPVAAGTPSAIDRDEVAQVTRYLSDARLWWDHGFEEQVALISACDLLIAPHTGFAFLAGALGTPWLTLSCCRWPEYYFDPTPFHSIFPTCPSYPSLGDDNECTRGTGRNRCLSDLEARVDEISDAAALLMRADTTYDQCVARHLRCVDDHPHAERFHFFDGRDSLVGRHVRTGAADQ